MQFLHLCLNITSTLYRSSIIRMLLLPQIFSAITYFLTKVSPLKVFAHHCIAIVICTCKKYRVYNCMYIKCLIVWRLFLNKVCEWLLHVQCVVVMTWYFCHYILTLVWFFTVAVQVANYCHVLSITYIAQIG